MEDSQFELKLYEMRFTASPVMPCERRYSNVRALGERPEPLTPLTVLLAAS